MTIRSFSGTHEFHPSVIEDTDAPDEGTADDIIFNIESGRCPRCERPLPQPPEFPAGSRVTECRSIPICGPCGSDEVYQAMDAAMMAAKYGPDAVDLHGLGISSAGCWPLPTQEIDERRARYERQMRPAILTVQDGADYVVTEDGSTPVINPCKHRWMGAVRDITPEKGRSAIDSGQPHHPQPDPTSSR
jgi:hypothetical protein